MYPQNEIYVTNCALLKRRDLIALRFKNSLVKKHGHNLTAHNWKEKLF